MIALEFKGELSGVTDFGFIDSPTDKYEFKFWVQCSSCRERHDKPVTFDRYEISEIHGSRGEANLNIKCKFCGKSGNVSVVGPLNKYTSEDDKPKVMATFDCRGVDLAEFVPQGTFQAIGEKGSKFEVEFDDGEWYDFDEKASQEVSITETQWTLTKAK